MKKNKIYDFAGFRLDTEQQSLLRDDELVQLTPKAYETLLVLVRNSGKVISKDTLLDEVWADTFVEEATLAQNISTLRKAFAKYDSDTEFITTIPRRGYRFVEDVVEISMEDEEIVLEKHSVTHIVAEQRQIHDSPDAGLTRKPRTKRLRNQALVGFAIVGAAILALSYVAISYYSNPKSFYNSKFQKFRIATLFSGTKIKYAVVSRDGKYLAVVNQNADGDAIQLKQIEEGNMIDVLPKSNLSISGVSFSPAGEHLFYSAYGKPDTAGTVTGKLYRIPILGGAPKEILSDIDSPVSVSEDGRKIAFVRNKINERKSAIVVADIEGGAQKELAVRDLASGFSNYGLSWSVDGEKISSAISDGKDFVSSRVAVIDVSSGELETLGEKKWLWIGKTQWLKDGSGIAFVAYGAESPNLTDEIWFTSYPRGETRVISNGLTGVVGLSLTDNAESIVATRQNRITSSFVAPLDDLNSAEEIDKTANGEALLQLGAEWTSANKILFAKTENGNADIWSMNAGGEEKRRLTSEKSADYFPKMSFDGKYIFFLSNRSGIMNVWRMDSNGENPIQITTKGNFSGATVSQNNDYIYYLEKDVSKPIAFLFRADFDGKNAKQLTNLRTSRPQVSPDGKYVLCFYPQAGDESKSAVLQRLKFTILSAETGDVIKQFAALKSRAFPLTEWSADSKSFLFLAEGATPTLWKQIIDGDKFQKLKEFNVENIYQFAVSKDGKSLFYETGKEVNSVIRFSNTSER